MIRLSRANLALQNLLVMVHDAQLVVATSGNGLISLEIGSVSAGRRFRVLSPVASISVVFR